MVGHIVKISDTNNPRLTIMSTDINFYVLRVSCESVYTGWDDEKSTSGS